MKLMWLGYLVYSLGNYAMKLCIETGLTDVFIRRYMHILTDGCTSQDGKGGGGGNCPIKKFLQKKKKMEKTPV
jgi:hypothetical protein